MSAAEPAVIDALVAAFAAAFTDAGEDGVTVADGPTGEPAFVGESLAVGTQNDETGDPAADAIPDRAGLMGSESASSVNCELTVLGDGMEISSYSPVRARAYVLYEIARAAIPAVSVPGVMSLRVGQRSLIQRRVNKGPLARVQFSVDFQAIE